MSIAERASDWMINVIAVPGGDIETASQLTDFPASGCLCLEAVLPWRRGEPETLGAPDVRVFRNRHTAARCRRPGANLKGKFFMKHVRDDCPPASVPVAALLHTFSSRGSSLVSLLSIHFVFYLCSMDAKHRTAPAKRFS